MIANAEPVDENATKRLKESLEDKDGHWWIVGATDGGMRKITREYGSQGWLIATPFGTILWKGTGPAPGNPNSSYRTEGYGTLGLLTFLYHFLTYWQIEVTSENERPITTYTDSLSMISKTTTTKTYGDNWYASMFSQPHADVLMQIRQSEQDIYPLQLQPKHVKAH